MAKMVGNQTGSRGMCACCVAPSWKMTLKRNRKRRERQAWKKEINQ